jgi:hypothetical protein
MVLKITRGANAASNGDRSTKRAINFFQESVREEWDEPPLWP